MPSLRRTARYLAWPIGPLVDAHPAHRPQRVTLAGRRVTLAPLDRASTPSRSTTARTGTRSESASGPICSTGPTPTCSDFRASLEAKARSEDPLFFAVIDNASGRALGYQTLHAVRPGEPRRRGRQRPVHARAATDGRRDRGAVSLRDLRLRHARRIAATNGSATPSTRRRGARRSGSASRSRGSSAST